MKFKTVFRIATAAFLIFSVKSYGEISLYLDGSPAGDFAAYAGLDQPPTLGIGSDNTAAWHGYVQSTMYGLTNGQINSNKLPMGGTSITPYNAPYGYEMTGQFRSSGIQFTADMEKGNNLWSLITLWNAASKFDVPVDSVFIYQGGAPGWTSAEVTANCGGTYALSPGGNVTFNAAQSTYSMWYDDWGLDDQGNWTIVGTHFDTENIFDNGNLLPYWSINGSKIAFGLTPTISYDKLVNGLGLTAGTYQLTLDLTYYSFGQDIATTTIEIIPEPATMVLLGLGGMFLRSRK